MGQVSLRWVYVHMIEETARHVGHADILREQTDGAAGIDGDSAVTTWLHRILVNAALASRTNRHLPRRALPPIAGPPRIQAGNRPVGHSILDPGTCSQDADARYFDLGRVSRPAHRPERRSGPHTPARSSRLHGHSRTRRVNTGITRPGSAPLRRTLPRAR